MTPELARSTYQQIETDGASKLNLVVMLYDGAIRFLGDAAECIQKRDLSGKAVATGRALEIISTLQSTLKFDQGGDIAPSLDRLYTYMNERILEGSAQLKTQPIYETIKLLRILNSAWTEIAKKEGGGARLEVPAVPQPQGVASKSALELFG